MRTLPRPVRAAASDVVMTARPLLVTIPKVELLEVGEDWMLASGVTTFTHEHLQSAIAAVDDPGVPRPRIKIGHSDPRFDGEPVLGTISNLHLSENDQTLIGDYVGVPAWLADIMPSAYPQRSVEGIWDYKSKTGQQYPFILTGVALLGDTLPGITTLEDLPMLFSGELLEKSVEARRGILVKPEEGKDVKNKVMAAIRRHLKTEASVAVEDIRRAYYDTLGSNEAWWWIREMQLDPPQLIVDDDEGNLYRVSYTINGSEIEFGEAVEVVIEYKDKAVAAGRAVSPLAVYASKEESRKEAETQEEEMTPEQLQKLGLSADATAEQIEERKTLLGETRVTELLAEAAPAPESKPDEGGAGAEQPGSKPETATPETPKPEAVGDDESVVTVDKETFEQTKLAASRGEEIWKKDREKERDDTITAAVKDGKFLPSRVDHWKDAWNKDPEGTKAAIASLAPGLVPVEPVGHTTEAEITGDAYPSHWLPEVQARKQEAK